MNIQIQDDEVESQYEPYIRDFNLRARQLDALGYRVTSRRRLRGTSFSQHEIPTARDYGVPPAQVATFTAQARALQLQVVDEIDRDAARLRGSKDWTGPHVHVQMFVKGRTPLPIGRIAPPPFPGD